MQKLLVCLFMLASTNSFASSKIKVLQVGTECKISKNSPTDSFPLYYKIDKVIFARSATSKGFDRFPWESKTAPATVILNSLELGGGLIFNVSGRLRMEQVDINGKKEILQQDIFSGTVKENNGSLYQVSGTHRVFYVNGDHAYIYDLNLTIVDEKKVEHKYFFECEKFGKLPI